MIPTCTFDMLPARPEPVHRQVRLKLEGGRGGEAEEQRESEREHDRRECEGVVRTQRRSVPARHKGSVTRHTRTLAHARVSDDLAPVVTYCLTILQTCVPPIMYSSPVPSVPNDVDCGTVMPAHWRCSAAVPTRSRKLRSQPRQ